MRVKRLTTLVAMAATVAMVVSLAACGRDATVTSMDCGQGEVGQVTIRPHEADDEPTVTVGIPGWVTQTQYGALGDGSADEQVSCSADDVGILYEYASDDPESFVGYYLDEGNLEQLHLFADRYTNVRFGTVQHQDVDGADVVWSWYSYDDEYGRANVYYVSATTIDGGYCLEVTVSQIKLDKDAKVSIDESTLWEVWDQVSLGRG